MAYAFVAEANAFSAATGTSIGVALGTNPTAGNLLYVVSSCVSDCTMTHTDSQSNSYTEIGRVREAAIAWTIAHGYANNVAGAATTVTATFSVSSSGGLFIYVLEISGLDDSAPLVDNHEVTDTGNNPTATATCTNTGTAGVLLSTGYNLQGGGNLAPGTGMTARVDPIWDFGGGYQGVVQYKATAADTNNYTSNFSGNTTLSRSFQVAAMFKEAGGGGGGGIVGNLIGGRLVRGGALMRGRLLG